MIKKLFTFSLFFICTQVLLSQSDIAIGQWKSHLPYQFGRYVTQSESTVYFATDWSVVAIDKEERSVDFISTVDGLSGTGVGIIKYHQPTETLVVTYDEGVIDLVQEGGVITLTDIQNFVKKLYGVSISTGQISAVTEEVWEEVLKWKSRALQAFYVLIY